MAELQYLSTAEASQFSRLSESYVSKLRSTGGGSPFLKIGRRCVYRRDQFEKWLDAHQCNNTSELQMN